jgi:hypothetical protein
MATLLDIKRELSTIKDITSDKDFSKKPKQIRIDLLNRQDICKQVIATHMDKIGVKK